MKNIFTAIIALCLFSSLQVNAQFNAFNVAKLDVYASVNQGGEPIGKVIATLYEDAGNTGEWVQMQQMKTNGNGEFSFKLDYNSNYMIEMCKANYISKKITFNTNVHDMTINSQDFYFNVELIPGSNSPATDAPVGNVYFHTKKNVFDYELNYAKAETN